MPKKSALISEIDEMLAHLNQHNITKAIQKRYHEIKQDYDDDKLSTAEEDKVIKLISYYKRRKARHHEEKERKKAFGERASMGMEDKNIKTKQEIDIDNERANEMKSMGMEDRNIKSEKDIARANEIESMGMEDRDIKGPINRKPNVIKNDIKFFKDKFEDEEDLDEFIEELEEAMEDVKDKDAFSLVDDYLDGVWSGRYKYTIIRDDKDLKQYVDSDYKLTNEEGGRTTAQPILKYLKQLMKQGYIKYKEVYLPELDKNVK